MKVPTPKKLTTPYLGAFLTFWDGPHSVWGMCSSLNKSTSYPSLCLSLNSFCDETSRTWASLSPPTRCVISVKRLWVLVPIWVIWFQIYVNNHSLSFELLICKCFLNSSSWIFFKCLKLKISWNEHVNFPPKLLLLWCSLPCLMAIPSILLFKPETLTPPSHTPNQWAHTSCRTGSGCHHHFTKTV